MGGSLFKDSLWSIMSSLLTTVLGIISSIMIARFLGPAGKGIYTLVMLVPALMARLGNLGSSNAATYFIARAKEHPRPVLFAGLKLTIMIGGGLYGLLYASFPWWRQYYQTVPTSLFHLTMPLAGIIIISNFLHFALLGTGRVDLFSLSGILKRLIGIGLIWGFFFLPGDRVRNVVYASVAGPLCAIGVELFFLKQSQAFVKKEPAQPVRLRQLVAFGGITYIITISQFISYRVDQFLIPIFLSSSALGIYSIAVTIVEEVMILPAAVQMAIVPRVSRLSRTASAEMVVRVLRHLMTLMLVMIVGLVVVGRQGIPWVFGGDYADAYWPMLILLPGMFCMAFWKVLCSYFVNTNQPGIPAMISIGATIINVVLNLTLIPAFELYGAALASTISYACTGSLILFLFCRKTGLTFRQAVLPGRQEWQDYQSLMQQIKNKLGSLFI